MGCIPGNPWCPCSPRGLALSQFAARYMRDKELSPAKFKAQLDDDIWLKKELKSKALEINFWA